MFQKCFQGPIYQIGSKHGWGIQFETQRGILGLPKFIFSFAKSKTCFRLPLSLSCQMK